MNEGIRSVRKRSDEHFGSDIRSFEVDSFEKRRMTEHCDQSGRIEVLASRDSFIVVVFVVYSVVKVLVRSEIDQFESGSVGHERARGFSWDDPKEWCVLTTELEFFEYGKSVLIQRMRLSFIDGNSSGVKLTRELEERLCCQRKMRDTCKASPRSIDEGVES